MEQTKSPNSYLTDERAALKPGTSIPLQAQTLSEALNRFLKTLFGMNIQTSDTTFS